MVKTGVAAGVISMLLYGPSKLRGWSSKKGLMKGLVVVLLECKEPEFVIDPSHRSRWKLAVSKNREFLEPLLDGLGEIDIFLHDSEHSYENMYFEYKAAWKHLKPNGLLLSHDITWNKAFFDFASNVKRKPVHHYFAGIGGIRK